MKHLSAQQQFDLVCVAPRACEWSFFDSFIPPGASIIVYGKVNAYSASRLSARLAISMKASSTQVPCTALVS